MRGGPCLLIGIAPAIHLGVLRILAGGIDLNIADFDIVGGHDRGNAAIALDLGDQARRTDKANPPASKTAAANAPRATKWREKARSACAVRKDLPDLSCSSAAIAQSGMETKQESARRPRNIFSNRDFFDSEQGP
jgi:hypothetical protein